MVSSQMALACFILENCNLARCFLNLSFFVVVLDYGLEFNPDFTLSNVIQRICRTRVEKWPTGQWSTRKDQGQLEKIKDQLENAYKSPLLIVKFILLFNPGLCTIRESLHLDYCFVSKISIALPWHYVLNVLYYWVM